MSAFAAVRFPLLASAFATLALSACSDEGASVFEQEIGEASAATAASGGLDEVLADERRGEMRLRDNARHPAQTLAFFEIEPDHTVIEYAPGGGWYTAILAPWLAERGNYVAVGFSPEAVGPLGQDFVERVRSRGESFTQTKSLAFDLPPEKVPFYRSDQIPEELIGSVDRVVIFRTMHNLKRFGIADSEIESLVLALKPGGKIGVVQHRASPDAPADYVDGDNGYLKQADMIAFFEEKGLELEGTSEINANPQDTADYAEGVWTLPPSFAMGEENRETYAEIGESDRMTLLFRKPG